MRRRPWTRPALASALALLVTGSARASSCADLGLACPGPPSGRVLVDGRFDADHDGILEQPEVQCAIACLDGDAEEEESYGSSGILGGELAFDPLLRYEIDRSLDLPYSVSGALVVRGNGARIVVKPSASTPPGVLAALRRAAPRSACSGRHALAQGWTIEGLTFALDSSSPRRADVIFKGAELHFTMELTIRQCSFEPLASLDGAPQGFDIGVELRFALLPIVEECAFHRCRRNDIALLDVADCLDGAGGDCWRIRKHDAAGKCVENCDCDWQAETSSNAALLRLTLHDSLPWTPPADGPRSILAVRADNLVIERPTLVGRLPRNFVSHHAWKPTQVTIRQPSILLDEGSIETPLFLDDGPGPFLLEGGTYDFGGSDQLLLHASAATGARVAVRNVDLSPNLKFRGEPGRGLAAWTFTNCARSALAASARQWIGGVPAGLAIVAPDIALMPPSRLASGIPTAQLDQIFMNPDGSVWYCRDDAHCTASDRAGFLRIRTCPLASPESGTCVP